MAWRQAGVTAVEHELGTALLERGRGAETTALPASGFEKLGDC
jgi:hypothetical protein